MKNAILFFLIGISLNVFSQIQKINLQTGHIERNKKLNADKVEGTLGKSGDYFFILRSNDRERGEAQKKKLSIEKYDSRLNHKKTVPIEDIYLVSYRELLGKDDKCFEFFVRDGGDNLYLFYSQIKSDYNYLYKMKLNPKTVIFERAEEVSKQIMPNSDLDRRMTYITSISKDRNHLAISSIMGSEKNADYNIYIEVFNGLMESQWVQNTLLPRYNEGDTKQASEYLVDFNYRGVGETLIGISNQGVFNITKQVGRETRSMRKHLVYSFKDGESAPVINEIKFDGKNIDTFSFTYDDDGFLRVIGCFYYDKNKIDGLAYLKMDAVSLEKTQTNLIEFDAKNMEDFLTAVNPPNKKKDKKLKDIYDKIIDIYVHDNQSMTLLLEDRGGVYGNLKFINLSEKGKIVWIKNYFKYQNYHKSVSDMMIDDKLHLLFNNLKAGQKLDHVVFDHLTGKITTKTIIDFKEDDELDGYYYMPNSLSYVDEHTYIGVAEYFKLYKLLKFEFNQ